MLSEPSICSGLVKLDFECTAIERCEIDSSPRVMFAKAWRSTDNKNIFNCNPSFKLSANYLGLSVDATKGGNDE